MDINFKDFNKKIEGASLHINKIAIDASLLVFLYIIKVKIIYDTQSPNDEIDWDIYKFKKFLFVYNFFKLNKLNIINHHFPLYFSNIMYSL